MARGKTTIDRVVLCLGVVCTSRLFACGMDVQCCCACLSCRHHKRNKIKTQGVSDCVLFLLFLVLS